MVDVHRSQGTWQIPARIAWWALLLPVAAACWAATLANRRVRYSTWAAIGIVTVLVAAGLGSDEEPTVLDVAGEPDTAPETTDAPNNDPDAADEAAPPVDTSTETGDATNTTSTTNPATTPTSEPPQSAADVSLAANCDTGATGSVHNTGATTLWAYLTLNDELLAPVDRVLEPGQHADFNVPTGTQLTPGDAIKLVVYDDDTFNQTNVTYVLDCTPTPEPDSASSPATSTAASLLATLAVENEPARVGYDRDLFDHWSDLDGDGCNTRYEVLTAESQEPVTTSDGCRPVTGLWVSAFDGKSTTDPSTFDIDHLVPLAEAWDSGADTWSASRREAFANDETSPLSLIAVSASSNRSKSDRDPADWLPPSSSYHCTYAASWISVKATWGLSIDPQEKAALETVLSGCGALSIDQPSTTAPATTTPPTTTAPVTTTTVPATTTTAPTTTAPTPALENPGDVVNCSDFDTQAQAQAWFDTYAAAFGDVARLDRDGDGVACQSLP